MAGGCHGDSPSKGRDDSTKHESGCELGRMLADSHQDLLRVDGIEGIAEVNGQHFVLEGVVG